MRLLPLAFAGLAALAAPTAAQTTPPSAADAAAAAVEDDLHPLSLVAATAALVRERTGRYPATTFELLGAPEAARTGLRGVQLAALSVSESGGEASMEYVLVHPEVGEQTERAGRMTLAFEPDSAQHVARFELHARRDPDFGGRRILLARADPLEVHLARGRLCLSPDRLAALNGPPAFAAAAPYFGDRRALTVSFDALPSGRRVAATTLPVAGGAP